MQGRRPRLATQAQGAWYISGTKNPLSLTQQRGAACSPHTAPLPGMQADAVAKVDAAPKAAQKKPGDQNSFANGSNPVAKGFSAGLCSRRKPSKQGRGR